MKVIGVTKVIAALALLTSSAFAADLPTKAVNPFGNAYPTTKCGMYYGVGTGGSATSVTGAAVGTQMIGGELDAILGYTCPLGSQGFWFVEGSVGIINPFGNSLAVPSLPVLPTGVTASPALPYFFAGIVEQQLDVANSKQWLIAPLVGAGFIYRLSNGSVADVWAGWQLNSQSICTFGMCGHSGNGGRVGVAFKF